MRSAVALVLAIPLCGCSRDPQAAPAAPAGETRTAKVETRKAARPPRSMDVDVVRFRAALDRGRVDEARALLPLLEEKRIGTEDLLLRARLDALSGNAVDAIRKVETARKDAPSDPDVFATAAEIYAAAGKLDAGWEEERAGEKACGDAAELDRARACLWLSRSGGARKGLELLQGARTKDPDLPFTDRALSQAHLLVGKEDAAARKGPTALEHARLAASLDPDDVDARRFLSEALLLNGDFEGGVREIEALVEEGQPLGAELALLHKKAGIAALLEHDRERAIGHFAAARKLGLDDEALSTGARVLAEEAGARVDKGVEAYKAGDLDAARAQFTAALELDPDRIAAKNHLAVVEFKRGDLGAAIALWRAVLETAGKEGLELPEPVHVNLAKAVALSGDVEAARSLLEDYLVKHPDGRFTTETRAALDALPPK